MVRLGPSRTDPKCQGPGASACGSEEAPSRIHMIQQPKQLEEGGALQLKDRRIVVKDIDALKDLAEAG